MMKQITDNFSSMRSSFSRMADGFSLVELVIVIVIIGLSSGIAVPIVSSHDMKAKLCEADATLGNLRTQLRIYASKNGEYPIEAVETSVVGASWNDIKADDLNGKYFSHTSYTYVSEDGLDYTLTCASGSILHSDRSINQTGTYSGGK